MIFTNFLNFENECTFFVDNLRFSQNSLHFADYSFLFFLYDITDFNTLSLFRDTNLYTKSLVTFINQTEDTSFFNNLENVQSIYHYSIPNTKLAYPEPFIASASLMHNDLWFVHILVYQYWLWFVFVFIIIFFFIGFITTVRWCNMRVRPRRETRGVSRSKCGDLVTAVVPVSWAASIIISESTDAIDYYDGFGTTELVIGIRAYQWGWEYYYPKDIDLNYNIKNNYSSFIGNSLKYNSTTGTSLHYNNPWRFYQNKTTDIVVTPAHLLMLPVDNYKVLNFLNFNDIGANPLIESAAFKKIRMFSKTFTANLMHVPSAYSAKYKTLSSVYVNEGLYTNSYLYGYKRQHNFASSKAISNNFSTFFNTSSVDKWLSINSQIKSGSFNSFTGFFFNNYFRKSNNDLLTFDALRLHKLLSVSSSSLFFKTTVKFYAHPSILETVNNDTDGKQLRYPLFKLFTLPLNNLSFSNASLANSVTDESEFAQLFLNAKGSDLFIRNRSTAYKNFSAFTPNQSVLLPERSVRKFANISPRVPHLNFSMKFNTANAYYVDLLSNAVSSSRNLHLLSELKWIDPVTVNKIASNRLYFDSPYSPIVSNNPFIEAKGYDDCVNVFTEDTPVVLQGKEELMPNFLPLVYWNLYFANSTFDWRFNNNVTYKDIHSNFYLPIFSFYYDYDFRNWQSLELLEDAFWESSMAAYSFEEYAIIASEFNKPAYFDKFDQFYNYRNRNLKFKDSLVTKPFYKDSDASGFFYTNAFYTEDLITPAYILSTFNFFIFPLMSSLSAWEDSYESIKQLNHFYNTSSKIFFNFSSSFFQPHTYSTVFDSFRSDFEDFTWFKDDITNFRSADSYVINAAKTIYNAKIMNFFAPLSLFVVERGTDHPFDQGPRTSNYINLRNTVRNSIVTYNAIQKVFRSRFDEGRSNAKMSEFAYSYLKQPYLSSPRPHYERLLGKTKENFFKVNLYKMQFFKAFNNFYDTTSSLNFSFFDFPFLVALKSDAARYLWFDWYAKWGFYEVQPSSSSRYAIYGMPYFNKSFDFAAYASDAVSETENYLLRLSRARKNYLPNWVYTPYFYAKSVAWYRNNIFFDIFTQSDNSVTSSEALLDLMSWYWQNSYFINFHNYLFFPSNSNMNSFGKSSWKPAASIQSYYYTVTSLIDTLTKREYLYRQFLSSNNKLINLPFYLTNNPSNPLVSEIKAAFLFIDPIVYNNEYSRDIYYSSLAFFNFNILKSLVYNVADAISISHLSDYFFFYFFNDDWNKKLAANGELFKSQHRPMRKGISNMLRLHATGAVAMPIEIRLQILASSKDIIHSWAIPSAGIKIDCVPGYSSHKVMIFLVSGIFWGQCMEICGRYHHWMPIVVYFMKRDLFFLWCTHFVFLSGANNMWSINERQYANYVRVVSYDRASWASEFAK
jgi:heme/copper-type cytochrome/quinol oxidase subunit 2